MVLLELLSPEFAKSKTGTGVSHRAVKFTTRFSRLAALTSHKSLYFFGRDSGGTIPATR
jgi:hypothetical protein